MDWLRAYLRNPVTWKSLAYLMVKFFFGVFASAASRRSPASPSACPSRAAALRGRVPTRPPPDRVPDCAACRY
jgi:hypothetical protein